MNIFGLDITGEIGAMTAALAAVGAGIFGLNQYSKAERWKRAEFTIAQIRLLSEDATLAFCCRAIDWGAGPLIIPMKYRELFPAGQVIVQHSWLLMANSLRPSLHSDFLNEQIAAQFLLYRYAFDDFFSYLDALVMYRDLSVIRESDLGPIKYYLAQVKDPRYWDNDSLGGDQVFGDFVESFYHERVWPWLKTH